MSEFNFKENDYGYKLQVRDAKLLYSNFAGDPDKNNNGKDDRVVWLVVDDPDTYEYMLKDGWRFKTRRRDVNDESAGYADPFETLPNGNIAYPRTKLKLNFNSNRPPVIKIHTSSNKAGVRYDEGMVSELDGAFLTDVKLVVGPYHWNMHGASGTTGYINVMHATLDDDPFADDYMEEEEPF